MPKQPLAEIFGFPIDNDGTEAERHRQNRLCPFNNKVPNCTKDSITSPLGICSIFHGNELAIVCPVRLRQNWLLAEHAASFFFSPGTKWTTLLEVRLKDKHGRSACNIQFVICIKNEDYPASLQLWKVYRVLPDEKGARHNMIRVVDESGEDYLFPASYFVPVKLPQAVQSAILETA